MEISVEDVRGRANRKRLDLRTEAIASAVAGLNAGAHIALVTCVESLEKASDFAGILVESAVEAGACIGSLNLYKAAAALIPLRDLVQERFLADIWLIVVAPSPAGISRAVDEVRQLRDAGDARLLVVTTHTDFREAELPTAAQRAVIPIQV